MALENFGTHPKTRQSSRLPPWQRSKPLFEPAKAMEFWIARQGSSPRPSQNFYPDSYRGLHSLDLFFSYFPFASRQKKVTPRRDANRKLSFFHKIAIFHRSPPMALENFGTHPQIKQISGLLHWR